MERIINARYFKSYWTDGLFWFRLLGLGLVIKDTNKHPLIFSECQKLAKVVKLGKYSIKPLTR